MSLPPYQRKYVFADRADVDHYNALAARIQALYKYARHHFPGCMAEEGFRCDCGLSELEERLKLEGLL